MGAFWDAWNKQGQVNDQAAMSQIQQIGGLAGLMQKAQEQQQAQKVNALLNDPTIPMDQKRTSLVGLIRDPMQAAKIMHDIETEKANAALRTSQMDTQKRLLENSIRQTEIANNKEQRDAIRSGAQQSLAQMFAYGTNEPSSSGVPTKIMTDEAAAMQDAIERNARGERVRTEVLNPNKVRALSLLADPNAAVQGLLKEQTPKNDRLMTPGTILLGPNNEVKFQAPFAPKESSKLTPYSDIGKINYDERNGLLSPDEAKRLRDSKTSTTVTGLSPQAIEQAAERYALDGTMPPNLGRGAQGEGTKVAILNRAAALAEERGDTGNASRISQLASKAAGSAWMQLDKQKNLILAFERTAARNADIVLEESEKVERPTDIPAIDKWIQAGKKNIAGDPAVARLDTAVRSFVNEYAKVVTTVTGGGVTSDTARKEIDELLKASQTKEQVREVIALMKNEMNNRKIGYEEQIQQIRSGLTRTPSSAAPSPSAAPSSAVLPTATGPNGEKLVFKDGKWQKP